jgi:phosphatidylglycerol:prolipoprotein diacylglycerol transferase
MYAIAFPAIDPIALQVGPLAIRWYSLAYVVGIVAGWRFILRLAARSPAGVERAMIDDFVLWATLGVILGGRLGFVLFYRPDFYFANPMEIPALWRGGMSFHGGLLGMVASVFLFARRRGVSALAFADLVCAAAPIGLFFGRIANFINGELYGRASDAPWAMVFPRGGPDPRHPSQLYEATLEGLVLFIVLAVLVYRFRALEKPGLVAGAFFLGYGIARFTVEFVREPDSYLGFLYAGATMGQLLSLPLIAAGAWLIHYAARRR